MIRKTCFFAFITIVISCSTGEKEIHVDPEIIKLEESFIEKFKQNSGDAIDFLTATNKWIGSVEMNFLKSKLDSITPELGKFQGFELISFRGIGNDYVLRSYLARYERQPLRFNLTFYRPTVRWQLQNIEFDFQIDEELKESARVYRLNRNVLFEDHE
ncbi:MAG: hypothetical protein ACK5WO_06630 [Cyclobacteriaceae bacterium]|jgi:hypothetical protein